MKRTAGRYLVTFAVIATTAGLPVAMATDEAKKKMQADVIAVDVEGGTAAYSFRVTLRSPDIDCDQYADWWEVVRQEGTLVYRRILMHSHPDEQPFTRKGAPVDVTADETLIVRGHMHPTGYGGVVFRGSVEKGFTRWEDPPDDFADELAEQPPLPAECWH